MSVRILLGDMRQRLKELPDNSVDSCVCDPPYHLTNRTVDVKGCKDCGRTLGGSDGKPTVCPRCGGMLSYQRSQQGKGFMGQTWDGGDVAFQPETWAEVLRVLKPGGHLVAFSGTRTYHRMAVAIEDAGFEIRDQLAWVYGSGFPKSHDVSKQIDKAAGAVREVVGFKPSHRPNHVGERGGSMAAAYTDAVETLPSTEAALQWQGWGTALKPSWEPICLARKPLDGTVAANVLKHGTGAINIDGCRIATADDLNGGSYGSTTREVDPFFKGKKPGGAGEFIQPEGRWPANLCHDGSEEVLAGFPAETQARGNRGPSRSANVGVVGFDMGDRSCGDEFNYDNGGSAARFFYCAKATTEERGEGNNHPTVKPQALMRWLCRLVTPKGGTVLDPFMGSGSTAIACQQEGFSFIGCELSADYAEIARKRLHADSPLFADVSIESTGPSSRAA